MLLIQEKLDGIKTRYSDITATSSKALRTLEQARQLATKFQSTHEELTSWMSEVEEELMSSGGQSPVGEQIPQFQQRQKVRTFEILSSMSKAGNAPEPESCGSLCTALRMHCRGGASLASSSDILLLLFSLREDLLLRAQRLEAGGNGRENICSVRDEGSSALREYK